MFFLCFWGFLPQSKDMVQVDWHLKCVCVILPCNVLALHIGCPLPCSPESPGQTLGSSLLNPTTFCPFCFWCSYIAFSFTFMLFKQQQEGIYCVLFQLHFGNSQHLTLSVNKQVCRHCFTVQVSCSKLSSVLHFSLCLRST